MGLPATKRRQVVAPTPARTPANPAVALDWRVVTAILMAAAIPRLFLAVRDQGIFWPDEIFQSLEQAHRIVFGYGFIPWEFADGARSWLFPGAFVVLWKIAAAMGVRSAIVLVVLAKGSMVAVGLVGLYATMRIAERLGGATAGVLAGLLAATFPAALFFGHRCMAEVASGAAVATAVWLWLAEGNRQRMFLSGLITSLAVFLRYQNGLLAGGLLLALLVSARRREAITFIAGAAAGLVGGEILDWMTWGAPFHSAVAYLRYNLFQGRSADYGVSPWSYYLRTAWSSTGLSSLAIAAGLIGAWRRAPALVAIAIGFVAVHCLIPHKEYRFLMPVVPVLLALSAVGLEALLAPLRRHLPAILVGVVMSALMAFKAFDATLASAGQWPDQPEGAKSVWHHWEGANLALAETGTHDDLCGVLLAGLGAVWSGGFTYLHRDVPFLTLENAPNGGALLPFANYVIAAPGIEPPPGYVAVNEFGGWSVRRRDGGCASPPGELSRRFEDGSRP